MYMTSPKRKNGSTVVRLVVSFRKNGKVKNKIVKVVGQSKDEDLIKKYKKTARRLIDEHKKGLISLSDMAERLPVNLSNFLGKERCNNGFGDILGVGYKKLGVDGLIYTGMRAKKWTKAKVYFPLFFQIPQGSCSPKRSGGGECYTSLQSTQKPLAGPHLYRNTP